MANDDWDDLTVRVTLVDGPDYVSSGCFPWWSFRRWRHFLSPRWYWHRLVVRGHGREKL